jgi:RNA polymerase sigma-70 factor (ECF subfamily)
MMVAMEARDSPRDFLAKARQGDRKALERLLEAQTADLERFVRSRLGARLRERLEAADVVQETFARALGAFGEFQGDEEALLGRWLRSIAEHVILEAAKRERRDDWAPLEREVAGDEVSPSRGLQREERFARLEAALQALSPEYREVVVLSRLRGLKVREIAERLGKSPNAVAHMMSRALKKLRESLGETESLHLPPRRLDEGRADDGE